MKRFPCGTAVLLAFATGCSAAEESGVDADRGAIEATLELGDRVNWPGLDQASGRVIPMIRGFANDVISGYWFLGFASRRTADSFWFCKAADIDAGLCPLDANRRLNWEKLQGNPIFTRIPGDPEFSPFWQQWVVTVPDDYVQNSIKTPETLDAKKQEGLVTVEPLRIDFGDFFLEEVGFKEVVLHCALVLEGTLLEGNGESTMSNCDRPNVMFDCETPMIELQRKQGWFQRAGEDGAYVLNFFDFSPSDGVFPAATDEQAASSNRPLMRFANIYILWRDCEADPRPPICDLPNYAYADTRPVSERGLGQDITGDGDSTDTNNVLGSLPCALDNPAELPYSPLWGPQRVNILSESDSEIALVDSYADQFESDLMSAFDIFDAVEAGQCDEPVPMEEDETGNPVPGNEGRVFFNCPNPVAEGFVPHPCAP